MNQALGIEDDTLTLLNDEPFEGVFKTILEIAAQATPPLSEDRAIGFAVVHIQSAGITEQCSFCGNKSIQPSRFIRWLLRSGHASVRPGDHSTEALVFVTWAGTAHVNWHSARSLVDGLLGHESMIGRHAYSVEKVID